MTTGTGAPFVVPEYKALFELRLALARGGLSRSASTTAEEGARLVAFTTIAGLLRFLNELKRRAGVGESCRIVEVKHTETPGRFHVEFLIERTP